MITPKTRIKIGIIIAFLFAICIIVIYLTLYIHGFVAYITIEKLTHPPSCYFNLTVEDVNKYPIIGEIIEKIEEENRTSFYKEINWKKGREIYHYMCNKVSESGENCGGIYFFYKGYYYKMTFGFT